VLHYAKLEMLARDSYSRLLDLFLSYKICSAVNTTPVGAFTVLPYFCNLQMVPIS
jgi:hypothetical protein